MKLPIWAWILLAVVALIILLKRAAKSYRASLRRELRARLAASRPDLEIASESEEAFRLRDKEGKDLGTMYLHRLYRESPNDPAGRQHFFDILIAALSEGDSLNRLSVSDRGRLMPRIVNERMLDGLKREAPNELPVVPLGVCGLHVVLVLDSPNSVAYLTKNQLAELDLDETSGLAVAKENLSTKFSAEVVRAAVEKPDLNVIKSMDTYDAARLLLVPSYLNAGESVVALIPDRDTLVLVRPPANGDWSGMRKLARNAAGEPLLPQPLVVTSAGFAAAPQ